MWLVKTGRISSSYTRNIISQLRSRNYLKPTWKTLHKFDKYIKNIKLEFGRKRQTEIINYVIKNDENKKNCTLFMFKIKH